MIPLQLTLEGFLCYKEKQTINFDGSQLWALCGPNGVGKSALFDAITFALYNMHRGNSGTKGTSKDLINQDADRLIVIFDFIVDGVIYRIKRILPHKGRTTREAFVVNAAHTGDLDHAPTTRIDNTDSEDGLKEWVKQIVGMDYATFTSSCLLLQGKSEQLLDADPKRRYEVLAELLDLMRYQKLYDAADSRAKQFKGQVEHLQNQLRSFPIINDNEIDQTHQQLKQAETDWQEAQQKVERFAAFLEQAKRWEADTSEIGKISQELQKVQALLARDAEIKAGFSEYRELHETLPALRQIVTGATSLRELKLRLEILHKRHAQLKNDLQEAVDKRNVEQQNLATTECGMTQLQEESKHYLLRLAKLDPMVNKLENIEKLQCEISEREAKITALPASIEQKLVQAEQQMHILEKKEAALSWLTTFTEARVEFAAEAKSEQDAKTREISLQQHYATLQQQQTELQVVYNNAQEQERHLHSERQTSQARLDAEQKRLKKFESVAAKHVCDVCGQEITGEHVQREKAQLQQEIDARTRELLAIKQKYQEAYQLQKMKGQELIELNTRLEEIKNSQQQSFHDQRIARDRAQQQAKTMRNAYIALAEDFQKCIIEALPTEDSQWLTTVYPSQNDIATLKQEVRAKANQAHTVTQLKDRYKIWVSLTGECTVRQEQLRELLQAVDIQVATDARTEKRDIENRQNVLTTEISKQRQRLEQAQIAARDAETVVTTVNNNMHRCESDIQAEYARIGEVERVVCSQMATLSEQWQIQAQALDKDGLATLEQRHTKLTEYDSLFEKLTQAHEQVNLYKQRLVALNAQIAAYPAEAKRPAREVGGELENKRALQKQAGNTRDELRGHLAAIEQQRQQRQEMEQHKREAEKTHHLYTILAKHLGRNGLQLYLLSQAERAIVDFANQTLGGLSHGRMYLELRRESEQQASADKALDLMVYDRETGKAARAISFVSGSQKFRIAVSLALAIGRYTNRTARRVESVIIDEGFGSLDKAGRDDMIRELTALGQQLSRIILVSHQEEFAYAFPNRYHFKLVNGASRVSLMEVEE